MVVLAAAVVGIGTAAKTMIATVRKREIKRSRVSEIGYKESVEMRSGFHTNGQGGAS